MELRDGGHRPRELNWMAGVWIRDGKAEGDAGAFGQIGQQDRSGRASPPASPGP
jgi:hypothetical protein